MQKKTMYIYTRDLTCGQCTSKSNSYLRQPRVMLAS